MGVVYNQVIGNTLYTDNPSVLTAATGTMSGCTVDGLIIQNNSLVQGKSILGIEPNLADNWYMKITASNTIPAGGVYNFKPVQNVAGSSVNRPSSSGDTHGGIVTPFWWGNNTITATAPPTLQVSYGTSTIPFNQTSIAPALPTYIDNNTISNQNIINLLPGTQTNLITTSSISGNIPVSTVSPYQTFTTPTGSVTADSTGLLPPSTQIIIAPINIPVTNYGTLPVNTVITTPTGTVTTTPTGTLPPDTVVTTPTGTVTTGPTGILPTGTVVITPSTTITVNHDGTLPEGTILTVPINGFTVPPELGNIVGKRLIVNEYYIGIITGYTSTTISVNAPNGMDIRPINGIWRMEVTDNIGRAPICIATQIAVSNWAAYPILNVDGSNYDESYPTSITYSPEGTEIFATRGNTLTTNIAIRHEFPAWVEHAHLLGDGTYELAEDPNIDTDMPYMAYYVRNWPNWQWGRVVSINKDALPNYEGNLFSYINTPGMLYAPEANVVSRITDKIYIARELDTSIYDRDLLATCSLLEVAMSPTATSYSGTIVERTVNAISEYSCSLVEKTSNTNINNIALYLEEPWLLDNRANLYGINVLELAAPKVVFNTSITAVTTPIITVEASVLKSSGTVTQGPTILLKRGLKANLPSSAAIGEPLVTLDTAELFIGTGTGLRKISDVVVSETEPSIEDQTKLWYNPADKTTKVYKDGSWQITTSDASRDYGEF
jgi:hypothetical protein